jgi:hypothetical protein
MELKLKTISKEAIPAAIEKIVLYRNLNQPFEAESICRDVLAVDPENQQGIRLLGLSLTDQFIGKKKDPYLEAERLFAMLKDPYERQYLTGLVRERRAKAELRAGQPPYMVTALLYEALKCYAEAEKCRPPGNDEAILRWNGCVRLAQSRPEFEWALKDMV